MLTASTDFSQDICYGAGDARARLLICFDTVKLNFTPALQNPAGSYG